MPGIKNPGSHHLCCTLDWVSATINQKEWVGFSVSCLRENEKPKELLQESTEPNTKGFAPNSHSCMSQGQCRDSTVSLWICLRHLTNLHALMPVINLCFKPLMLQSELSSGDFTALFLSASSSTGGLSGSRTSREASAGNTGRGHVLPKFLPPQFTAYNPDTPEFCFSVGFLFLANWVPEEGANTPNSMVEVVDCGVVDQHEAKVSPTKPLLGTWY